MTLLIFLLLAGSLLLYLGAEILVHGSVALALRFKVSLLVIGLTLVAFGTSAPELAVNIRGALEGLGTLSVGNAIGANLLTTGGILGLCVLIKPAPLSSELLKRDIPMMVFSTLLVLAFTASHQITRFEGAILLFFFFLYLAVLYVTTRTGIFVEKVIIEESRKISPYALWDVTMVVGGIILLLIGSRLLVHGAVTLGKVFGIQQDIIGLTVVSIGTSLPELTISIVATLRKRHHITLGTIFGSNIFNLLGILGISSLIRPLRLDHSLQPSLLWFLALQLLLYPIFQKKREISRPKGAILLCVYLFFFVTRFI